MRMIPNCPVPTTASAAERRVFELLEATPMPEAVALHSLRVSRHSEKVSTEADFVVVHPGCLLILEVKGGRIRQEAGIWYYRDRHNVDHPSREGPFRQAEGAMYGLRTRLRELVGVRTLEGMALGYMVVTPDCSMPVANVEWDREMVADESTLRGLTDLEIPLRRAMDYWRDQRGMRKSAVATERELQLVLKSCRPDFEPVRSLAADAASVAQEMVILTEQQYRVLDYVWDWERLIVEGGAGTGKTLLGAEAARRHSEAGLRVLLTCRSPVLAAWLAGRLPRNVHVAPHRTLGSLRQDFDVLICDEAQDILAEEELDTLDGLIDSGLETGHWLFLLDPNHQTDVLGTFDETVYEFLKSLADGRPIRLAENIRNTAPVVWETSLVTGARLERALVKGDGTIGTGYPSDPADEATWVRSWLREFRREELDPGGVTIVTPDGSARFWEHLPRKEREEIRALGGAGALEWPLRQTTIASVTDFKGLENDAVIVADLWDADPHEDRNTLYVAMTRSRVSLRVAWPEHRRGEIDELKAGNINLLRNLQ